MQRRFRTITLAFILSFITIASLSLYSIRQFSALKSYSDAVDHTNKVITHLHRVKDVLREFDMREREYMILKDPKFLKDYNAHIRIMDNTMKNVKNLVKDNDEQERTLILLRSSLSLRVIAFRKNIAYVDTNKSGAISPYYMDGLRSKQECYNYVDQMLRLENTHLYTRYGRKQEVQYLTTQTTRFLLVTFFILTIVLFFLMIYELKQKMRYQEELQAQLMDLENSHAELEQIAFAASHDMQEPLRKIKIFGDRLLWIRKGSVDEELKTSVDKMSAAANEVQELTQEIIKLASLVRSRDFENDVKLSDIIKEILEHYNGEIEAKNAYINTSSMPDIAGDRAQLKILFEQLIDNALKFSNPNGNVKISINATITTGEDIAGINPVNAAKRFYRIVIADNGIGFDNTFVDKIFKVFQRLHNNDAQYRGKGIGLAICQRIMTNHRGYITAAGTPGKGASFVLYFPME